MINQQPPCLNFDFQAIHAATLEMLVIRMNNFFNEGWQLVPNTFFPESGVVILFRKKDES